MIGKILKIILLGGVLIFLAWLGLTCYSNFIAKPGEIKMPDENRAAYSFEIKNTGNVILTDNYNEQTIQDGGKSYRIFTLYGFWELRKQKYSYNKAEIVLDESIFGPIIVKRR